MSCTQVEDLPQQVEGDLVDTTWPRLQELLEKHPEARAGAPGRSRTLALFGVLCRLCWPQFVAAGICRLFYIVTGYAQPLGLYIILRRFGTDDAYGWTAVGTHFAVYGTTLAGLTAAVDVGLLGGGRARDEAVAKLSALVAPVAPRALVDGLRSSPTAGAFAVAWVLAKFTEIPRLAVTLALTPRVAAMRSVVRLAVRGVVS